MNNTYDIINAFNITNANEMIDSDNANARLNLLINLPVFEIELQKEQYDSIMKLLNEVSNYQKFQMSYYATAKYLYYKPKVNILHSRESKLAWWRYAINMVIKQMKYQRGESDIFKIPIDVYTNYEYVYKQCFPKYYNDKESLTQDERDALVNVIECAEMKDLYLWSKPVLQGLYEERQRNKNKKSGVTATTDKIFSFFSSKIKEDKIDISEEEKCKVAEILEKVLNEEIVILSTSDIETKTKFIFQLNEGSFTFTKKIKNSINNITNTITEGFQVKYRNLYLNIRKGEYFFKFDSELQEFSIAMFTKMNNNITTIPITYVDTIPNLHNNVMLAHNNNNNEVNVGASNNNYFWRINFAKNNPTSDVNSFLSFQINKLNFIYNQSLIERIISYFSVNVEEQLANIAMVKFTDFKGSAQETLKQNIHKNNIINVTIKERQIMVPINKYDIKNSKMFLLNLGNITLSNTTSDNTTNTVNPNVNTFYSEKYSIVLHSLSMYYFPNIKSIITQTNKFEIISNIKGNIEISLLDKEHEMKLYKGLIIDYHKIPLMKIKPEIKCLQCNISEYTFALIMYMVEILSPTKGNDFWSQLNVDKEEIKANAKNITKVSKKNNLYFVWEEYYAVLANGYLYFYNNMEDEEYTGYFFLSNTVIDVGKKDSNGNIYVSLRNKLGSIELMFKNESEMIQWRQCVNERINEMKIASEVFIDEEEKAKESVIGDGIINSGNSSSGQSVTKLTSNNVNEEINESEIIQIEFTLLLQNINANFYVNNVHHFSMDIPSINLSSIIRNYDYTISLTIQNALAKNLQIKEEFQTMLYNKKDNDIPLIDILILICDNKSPKYKNVQFDVELNIGNVIGQWSPDSVRNILSIIIHNDILKYDVEREIFNENIQNKTNFINPTQQTKAKEKCSEYIYTYMNFKSTFKNAELIWIQPILYEKFLLINIENTIINAEIKADHFIINGSLGDTQIYDLSHYPYSATLNPVDNDITNQIFGKKESISTSFITFEYSSMYPWCPLCKGDKTSIANVNIVSPYLIYMHTHFLRCFDYLISEFLGALGSSEEIKQFQNEQFNISPRHEKDSIDFMDINLTITNPQIIMKPRFSFKEYFLIDLGTINLNCSYEKVFGKVRNDVDDYRWSTTYQFDIKNFNIKTEDEFVICEPSNCVVNMHVTESTDMDKICYSEYEFDYSYQFDVFVKEISANLRQRDFTNFMKCVDLNILYDDGLDDKYDYQKQKLMVKEQKQRQSILNKKKKQYYNEDELNKLKELYWNIIANVFLQSIKCKLYLENIADSDGDCGDSGNISNIYFPFLELQLNNFSLNVIRKLNFNKYITINIFDIEIFRISEHNSTLKEKFLINTIDTSTITDKSNLTKTFETEIKQNISNYKIINYNSYPPLHSNVQFKIQITINSTYDKSIILNVTGFTLLFRFDTVNLLRCFFLDGFPYYNPTSKDIPNDYEDDEENLPSLSLFAEIKKPLICLLSDSINNTEQDMICLTTEVIVGMTYERISKIKEQLRLRYKEYEDEVNSTDKSDIDKERLRKEIEKDHGYISSINVSLLEIFPFMIKMKDVFSPNYNELFDNNKHNNKTSLRKLTENFKFSYENKLQIQYVSNPRFVQTNLDKINIDKITFKISYRDLVLFFKIYEYNIRIFSNNYNKHISNLSVYSKYKSTMPIPKGQIIDKGLSTLTFISHGVLVILIDDHANTLYPFLSFSILDLYLLYECVSKYQNTINIDIIIKAHSYNYLAGIWEPIIEKSRIFIEYSSDISEKIYHRNLINIKSLPIGNREHINVNISDLSLAFLIKTLNGWIDKLKKVKEDINTAKEHDNMKITNHKVINYSGMDLNIYRIVNKHKEFLDSIKENNAYEIEYFHNYENNMKDNDDVIRIDAMGALLEERFISFDLPHINLNITNNILNIDNMRSKIHELLPYSTNSINNDTSYINSFNYIISKITFKNQKKNIYFYSPLIFKNKTDYPLSFTLIKKRFPTKTMNINPKETIGIPYDYISNGTIQIFYKNIPKGKVYQLTSFMVNNQILEELIIDRNIYINLFHSKSLSKYKIVYLRMSYSITNCLPFDIQVIFNEQNEMYNISKNETVNIPCISFKKNLKCLIFFYSFHPKKEIVLYNVKEPNKQTIPILFEDNENNVITILASIFKKDTVQIVLHAGSIVINHTGLSNLKIYSCLKNGNGLQPIPNQIRNYNFFIINDEKYLVFKYNDLYVSNKISLKAIGTSSVIELNNIHNQNDKKSFIMEISLSRMNVDIDLYTTMIKLLPKNILFNKLDFGIQIIRKGKFMLDTVPSNCKLPIFYCGNDEISFVPLILQDNRENYWSETSPISLTSGCFYTIKCVNTKTKEILYFNVEKKIDESSTYIILTKASIDNAQIVIENYSKCIGIEAYHVDYMNESKVSLPPRTKSLFAWSACDNTNLMLVFINRNNICNDDTNKIILTLNDNAIVSSSFPKKTSSYPYEEVIKITNDLYSGYTLKLNIDNEEGKFNIKITDYIIKNLTTDADSLYLSKEYVINIYIERLGISIIGDNRDFNKRIKSNTGEVLTYNRSELCYITLENILMYNKRLVAVKANNNKNQSIKNEFQIIIKNIEIDNQISYIKTFPILLKPIIRHNKDHNNSLDSNSKKNSSQTSFTSNSNPSNLNTSMSISSNILNSSMSGNVHNNSSNLFSEGTNTTNNTNNDQSPPFFNLAFVTKQSSKNELIRIELFNYLIQEFELSLESNLIVELYSFIQNVTEELKTSFTNINPVFLNDNINYNNDDIVIKDMFYQPLWVTKTTIFNKHKIFVSQLTISSLEIQFSFVSQTKDKLFQKILQSYQLIASLLSTISNIENVTLKLSGCELTNFTGDINDLISNILYNYQQNMLLKILKLLGAIDFLGDPLNLFTSLGKGVQDLFQKPAKGIMRGPLQGALGLVGGTLSLAKHTFDGTMNTTSKLTSGLSRGMLMLTLDDEYISKRERKKITQRPKNVIEGVGYGLTSMAGGVFYGVVDVVRKPIQGAKKEKLKGLGKGLLKGLSGVVLKPISGVFDLVSKTTEGIKNTINIEQKSQQKRLPRVLYGKFKYMKSYNEDHAQAMELLKTKIDELKHENFDFYNCELFKNIKGEKVLIALLSKGLYIINVVGKEIKEKIDYKNIRKVSVDVNGKIILQFNKVVDNKMTLVITMNDDFLTETPEKLKEKINKAIQIYYDNES